MFHDFDIIVSSRYLQYGDRICLQLQIMRTLNCKIEFICDRNFASRENFLEDPAPVTFLSFSMIHGLFLIYKLLLSGL
jgi:hypothetical protein